jgi:hypothetical protein
MAGPIPYGARAVGALDRVDAELDELPAMEDLRVDDALTKVGPGGILRGRWLGLVRFAGQSMTWFVRPPSSRRT